MSKRKPYVKPEMERIQLVPEEAVLGGCKSISGAEGIGQTGNCMTSSCIVNAS